MRMIHDQRLELIRIEELGFDGVWMAARMRAFLVDTAVAGGFSIDFSGERCWRGNVGAAFVAVVMGEGDVYWRN